jgi:uncharacterized protein
MQGVPRVFIYHSPCMDGYASAYIAWLHAKQNKYEWESFIGLRPFDTPPPIETLHGKAIFMADICFSRDYIEQLHAVAASLVILDHHETSQTNMAGLKYAKFDMDMAGCWLTWEHFFPGVNRNWQIQYIGMRDLWKHKALVSCEAFTLAMPDQSHFQTFKEFHNFLHSEEETHKTIAKGKAMLQFQTQVLDQMASTATTHEWREYTVKIVNAGWPWTSELGHVLCKESDKTIAVLWISKPGEEYLYSVSLRSADHGPNVAKIAEELGGGGGHAHAAAFRTNELPWKIFANAINA